MIQRASVLARIRWHSHRWVCGWSRLVTGYGTGHKPKWWK